MNAYPTAPPVVQTPRHLTFRSSRIIYYGPCECVNCGVLICKMGADFGGNAFTYPDGPIYPNTEWNPHVCDPKAVVRYKAELASRPPASPPTEPAFPRPTCRGSYALGTARGACERCQRDPAHWSHNQRGSGRSLDPREHD